MIAAEAAALEGSTEHFVKGFGPLLVRLAPTAARNEVLRVRRISAYPRSTPSCSFSGAPAGAATTEADMAAAHVVHPAEQPVDGLRSLADATVPRFVPGDLWAQVAVTELLVSVGAQDPRHRGAVEQLRISSCNR